MLELAPTVLEYLPDSQATHVSTEVAVTKVEYFPAGHSVQVCESSGEYAPAGHESTTTVLGVSAVRYATDERFLICDERRLVLSSVSCALLML